MPNPKKGTPELVLTICDGRRFAHEIAGDEPFGMVGLAHAVHEEGYACWLRDLTADELVACSTAACYGCSREPVCEFLDFPEGKRGKEYSEQFLRTLLLKLFNASPDIW